MSAHGGSRNPEHTVFGNLNLVAIHRQHEHLLAACPTPTVNVRSWQHTVRRDRRNADRDLFGGWSRQVFQVSFTVC